MMFGASAISHMAQIGVSIEPEGSVLQQTPSTTYDASTYYVFGKKMLENFVNFASSFTVSQSQMEPNPTETYVPLSTLTTWFNNFQRRLEQNPNFWKWSSTSSSLISTFTIQLYLKFIDPKCWNKNCLICFDFEIKQIFFFRESSQDVERRFIKTLCKSWIFTQVASGEKLMVAYDLGRSFFSLYRAKSETLATLTTWKQRKLWINSVHN